MLECGCDTDCFVEFEEELVRSQGTEFCVECGKLIPATEEHYLVYEWEPSSEFHPYLFEGEQIHKAVHTCCEVCGDLVLSLMELGYCWYKGDARGDIQELHNYDN